MSIAAVLSNAQRYHVENTDVFDGCAMLPPKSIHAICSSPPYLGLRDYGIPPRHWSDGLVCCYGLEPDVASYVRHTVELFEEFRRVLRDDGVIWWNIGDSYSSETKFGVATSGKHVSALHGAEAIPSRKNRVKGTSQGNKLLIPHRVAIALADAGWIVRQDNVWAKKSPMPESISGWRWSRCRVKREASQRKATQEHLPENGQRPSGNRGNALSNVSGQPVAKWSPCPGCHKCEPNGGYVLRRGSWRTTGAHEFIFQIVKSGEYFCDGDAAAEIGAGHPSGNKTKRWGQNHTSERANGTGSVERQSSIPWEGSETRNPRSVWHLSSESYKGAHFATFPSELARRCLVPSLSAGGCCPQCGSQYAPRVSKERIPTRPGTDTKVCDENKHDLGFEKGAVPGDHPTEFGNRDPQRHIAVSRVEGYFPTCRCILAADARPLPPLVLEPFTGSGTTIQVATHLGFRAIGFEVNPKYIELAKERIAKAPRCLMTKKKAAKKLVKAMRHQLDFLEELCET